jgi:tetratricopeptide (TPR) repeat protein
MAEVEFPKAEAESTPGRPDNGSPASGARTAGARLPAAEHRRAYGLTSPPPDPAEALYYEGMAAYQHRNWEQALERFRRLKTLQPTRPGLDALLDEVQWFLQLEAAAPDASADLAHGAPRERTQPARRRGDAWRVWGVGLLGFIGVVALLLVALQVGAPGSAARSWQTFLPWNRASEQDAQELFNHGQERLTSGDYEGAQDAFRQLLAIAPDDPQARSGLARAERQQMLAQDYAAAEAAIAEDDWERAAAELGKILAVDSGYADAQARADFVARRSRLAALYADGSRLYDLGQWTAAIEQFEKIKELDSSYRTEAVNEFLFVCYLNAGQDLVEGTGSGQPAEDLRAVEQAVEYFSRALVIHPRNRGALEARRLGGLYLEALRTLASDERGEAQIRLEALVAEMQASETPGFGQGRIAWQLYELLLADADGALRRGDVPAAIALYRRAQDVPVDDRSRAAEGEMLARSFTPTPTPRPTNTPTPVPTPRPLAVVPQGPVTARSGPGSTYRVVGQVPAGSELEITGRRADGLWLRVCCVTAAGDSAATGGGVEGWLPVTAVEVRGDLTALAVVTPAPSPAPTATRAPEPTATTPALVCIAGQLRDTRGGAPLARWTVTLQGPNGTVSVGTDAGGHYRFANLAPGSYSVTERLESGWLAVSPNPTVVVLAPAAECVTVDFWNERAARVTPTPTRDR